MCGRLSNTVPSDAMARLFAAQPANDLPEVPNFNICPTDPVHVVYNDGDLRRLSAMRWGFLPHWYKALNDGPLLINARAETIADKPAFASACRTRRCLIPTSGYFEWAKDAGGNRLPWYFHRADGQPLVMAGIWQDWQDGAGSQIRSCAIVTTAASADLAHVHHRMPVVLDASDWAKWLGEEGKGAAPLMRPAAPDLIHHHRVATTVNSNRASGAELIEVLEDL
ncbi:SOS response-associated peptidase [Thalassobius sp. Cn5-15]|jgi:putative SOS response-associated peptidase YedK|uniref:SOS response-associated peptidase n=1 Tax=Thalassobius sp. Cn5-15 TaxID=2917763 RepID=UPI001EF1CBC2|nr:SOS response-associated peptidase [Thalassobius sp. Cn5-15]MCG7493542.1 SOS response-associated peptidase [Thalassobius sp. Cn5-15]